MSEPLSGVELLSTAHDCSAFECGKPELTEWLRRYALTNQQNGSARVFIVHRANRVVGYYALAAAGVDRARAPRRTGRGLANLPIPVILLARMAVDESEQGRGLGTALLKNALARAGQAAESIGARAFLVHAKDDDAASFYRRFDFEASPTDPLHLFLLMKDVRALLDE